MKLINAILINLFIADFIIFAAESVNNRIGTFDRELYFKTIYKDIDWDSYGKNTAECEKMRIKYNQLRTIIDSLKRNRNFDTIKFSDTINIVCDNWEKVSNKCKPSKLNSEIYQKYGPYMFEILDLLLLQAYKKYSLDIIIDKIDLTKLFPIEIDTNEYSKLPDGTIKMKRFFSEPRNTTIIDTARKIRIDITNYMINNGAKLQRTMKH